MKILRHIPGMRRLCEVRLQHCGLIQQPLAQRTN